MNPFDELYNFALELNCTATRNAELSSFTSFKIGGPASVLVTPDSANNAGAVLNACCQMNLPVLIVGAGSNILVSDSGYNGIVISTAGLNYCTYAGNGTIDCGAGFRLTSLCKFAYDYSLSGLEFAYGIPGSAGGAVYMNAGAYGGEMKDVLLACNHIAKDTVTGTFSSDELKLGYRCSVYLGNDYLITGMQIQLKQGIKSEIQRKMTEIINNRKEKQPLDLPSAGSVFKRPTNNYAGKLIEECGLKGYVVGGAQVSFKHAGFIVNTGRATAADVKELIAIIKETVFRKTNVMLETEIIFV